ncbi:hypothetical protein [Roseibium aggregatum]|uniref:hypothetical protein n=1 Tax=Roseibium aggregatum TaxID=187304 RepID=UPI0012F4B9AD|nr:hypothetical protein [Roseibium aggregatum]
MAPAINAGINTTPAFQSKSSHSAKNSAFDSALSRRRDRVVSPHLTTSKVYKACPVSFGTAGSHPDALYEDQQRGEARLSRKFAPKAVPLLISLGLNLERPFLVSGRFFPVRNSDQMRNQRSWTVCHQASGLAASRKGHLTFIGCDERHMPWLKKCLPS